MIAYLLAVMSTAMATPYSVRFCFNWNVDLEDAESGHDDYYTDSPQIARGVYWEIREAANHTNVYYTGYADSAGSNPGCTGFNTLYGNVTYDVMVFSKTEVNGNTVRVYDDSTTPSLFADTPFNNWTPSLGATYTESTVTAGEWVNVIAASSVTVFRHNGGITGETYNVYAAGEDATTGGCQTHATAGSSLNCTDGYVYVAPGHHDQKYVISHEVGHRMAYFVDDEQFPNVNYDDLDTIDTDECNADAGKHNMVSVEYQSAAAVEGVAHFIAATTFNDTSSDYCEFMYYKLIDWDGDEIDDFDDLTWIDCELAEHCDNSGESCGPVAQHDHFGDVCNSGITDRVGVEYDWLRFFWDLRTDAGVDFPDVMDIWDAADPYDWNSSAVSPTEDQPAERLRDAADGLLFLGEWDAWDEWNGVHR